MTATMVLMVGLPGAGKTTRARVLEGRLLSVAFRVLGLGTDVVVDFGLWSRDERSALRSVGASLGARVEVEFLDVPPDVQWERVTRRHHGRPAVEFAMTRDDLDGYRRRFQTPDEDELGGGPLPAPPAAEGDWAVWAVRRWPTLVVPAPV